MDKKQNADFARPWQRVSQTRDHRPISFCFTHVCFHLLSQTCLFSQVCFLLSFPSVSHMMRVWSPGLVKRLLPSSLWQVLPVSEPASEMT